MSYLLLKTVTDQVVNTTAVETSIFSGTVPANAMGTNKTLMIRMTGNWKVENLSGRTFTIRVKLGGTTVFTSVSAASTKTTLRHAYWQIVQIQNIDAGNQRSAFYMGRGGPGSAAGAFGTITTPGGYGTNATAIDTTAALTLEITVQLSTSHVNHEFVRHGCWVELVEASSAIYTETPTTSISVAPSNTALASFGEISATTFILIPSSVAPAQFTGAVQAGIVVLLPSSLDSVFHIFAEVVQTILSMSPTSNDRTVFAELGRQIGPITLTPTSRGFGVFLDRVSAIVQFSPTIFAPAQFIELGLQAGAVVLLPSMADVFTPGGGVGQTYVEAVQSLLTLIPSATALMTFNDPSATTFALATSAPDVQTMVERIAAMLVLTALVQSRGAFIDAPSTPFTALPTAQAVAVFVDRASSLAGLSPSAGDMGAFVDAPSPTILVVPGSVSSQAMVERIAAILATTISAQDRGALVDRPSATFTVLPTAQAVAAFVDRASSLAGLSPSAGDRGAFVDAPAPTILVVPGVVSSLTMLERTLASAVVVSSAKDIAAFLDTPQQSVVIVSTVRDTASFRDYPSATIVILPSAVDDLTRAGVIVEVVQALLSLLPSAKDILSAVEKPRPIIVMSPSTLATASFVERGRQAGPIVLLPGVSAGLVFNERPSTTIPLSVSEVDLAAFIEGRSVSLSVQTSTGAVQVMGDSVRATLTVLPMVQAILSAIENPPPVCIIVPSISDTLIPGVPGAHVSETVLATIQLLIGVTDMLTLGPSLTLPGWGHVVGVSPRALVVGVRDRRVLIVSSRGTVHEVHRT